MRQPSHPKGLAQCIWKLHLGTPQHQRRQQPASLCSSRGLKTISNLPPQIGDGGPGPAEHLDARGPQLAPTAPGRQAFRRTRQQGVNTSSGAFHRPAHPNAPTLAGWIRARTELKLRASVTTNRVDPLPRHKSGAGVIKPSGIRQQPTGQLHVGAVLLDRVGWIRRLRQRSPPEQPPQQQGQAEQQGAGPNRGESGQEKSGC